MSIINKKKFRSIKTAQQKEKKNTIMLVDDNVELLKEIKSLLSEDYHVITAGDGQEALDLIKDMENPGSIALIISDQRMPRLTGMELFERLMDIIPHTKRVLLTVVDDKDFILKSINKIYDYILKPFEPEEFRFIVKRAIESYELHQELVKASITDELTGLCNRRYIKASVKREIARVKRGYEDWKRRQAKQLSSKINLGFIMIDIDHFKSINNTYGHEAGDRALEQFGEILRKNCRDSDIIGRWGGEEFLVISCCIAKEEIRELVKRLHRSVKNHVFDLGKGRPPMRITCSIGFADYPFFPFELHHDHDVLTWEQVVNIADIALYAAKNSGRNAWVGLIGTNKSRAENLYQDITENIKTLIDNGELEVVSSLVNEDLEWEKPENWYPFNT